MGGHLLLPNPEPHGDRWVNTSNNRIEFVYNQNSTNHTAQTIFWNPGVGFQPGLDDPSGWYSTEDDRTSNALVRAVDARNEADQAIKDAEENAEQDRIHQEKVQARNDLDQYVSQSEKLYTEHGDKLSDEDKQNIDNALRDAKDALEKNESDKILAARDSLQTVMHKVSETLYQAASAEVPQPEEKNEEEDIIDVTAE